MSLHREPTIISKKPPGGFRVTRGLSGETPLSLLLLHRLPTSAAPMADFGRDVTAFATGCCLGMGCWATATMQVQTDRSGRTGPDGQGRTDRAGRTGPDGQVQKDRAGQTEVARGPL